MKKIQKRYIAIALSVLLVLVGITATTLALTQKPAETTTTISDPIPIKSNPVVMEKLDAKEIIAYTNDYRASKGLPALVENELLDKSACAKAQHMVDNKYWSHDAPDGTTPFDFIYRGGYNYSKAGENLAYGQKSDKQVVNSWIKSPAHETNLSGPYTDIGVCTLNNVLYQGGTNTVIVAHYGAL